MDIPQMLDGTRDAINVKRVFGEPYEHEGATVIPVARVSGGGGGGQGGAAEQGEGSGGGFGIKAAPAGVYVITDGKVRWEPAVDVNRIVVSSQVVILAVILLLRTVVKRARKRQS